MMGDLTKSDFLQYVSKYVETHPDVAPFVQESVSIGLNQYIYKLKQQRADLETTLVFFAIPRFKTKRERLAQLMTYVSKWRSNSTLRWDWVDK